LYQTNFADLLYFIVFVKTSYLKTDTVCASLNHRKLKKAEPRRLIPQKLALDCLIMRITANKNDTNDILQTFR